MFKHHSLNSLIIHFIVIFIWLNWLKEKIEFIMLIQGDMPSLLNHNMEGGSRHETNEFSQNVSLTFFK